MFVLNLDFKDVEDLTKDMEKRLKDAALQEGKNLAHKTLNFIKQEAQKNLKTRRRMYIDGLSFQKVGKDTWVISLDKSKRWIDDGLTPHEMIDKLLKNAKKSGPNGKYRAIPFEHNKEKQLQTESQRSLSDAVRAELKSKKIAGDKIETDDQGKAKIGLLHKFDVSMKRHPLRPGTGVAGMGRGPVGEPMKGWGKDSQGKPLQGEKNMNGKPLLAGVRVYQKEIEIDDPDNKGGKKKVVQKGVFTFRMVSEKQKGTGMWQHPGVEGLHAFEKAYEWALKEWEQVIKPSIVADLNKHF